MKLMDRGRRWLYRARRPQRLTRLVNAAQARLAAHGLGPARLVALEVTGRTSGKPVSFPVVVADLHGERYLVSMLGDNTNWVRNVRAAGGQAVLRHGSRRPIRLIELAPHDRAPVLRRYLECAPGARAHIAVDRRAPLQQFEQIAAEYPVFRITAR
jgi:deazaflavin-dependent oxidoreductase (nitroreductase family)